MVLRGPAGCGRSHLGRWLARRASELGAAASLLATHHPDGPAGSGLAGLIERHLRTRGLGRLEVLDRVREGLRAQGIRDESEAHALTELVRPTPATTPGSEARRVRFRSERERHILVERLLQRACRTRPAIVWLDDAHWDPSSLGFVRSLLARQPELPLLVVVTAAAQALASLAESQALLTQLVHRDGATELTLGPLDRATHRALLQEQLGLTGALADRVEERTAGNPLFAVQIVSDWVQRRVLQRGPLGFEVREGKEAELPADLVAVWGERLSDVLRPYPPGYARALELGAVLGMEVDETEWAEACAQAGLEPTLDLVEHLCRLRLAARDPHEGRWSFSHAMLRESLLRRAGSGRRMVIYHRACAEMLRGDRRRAGGERLGRHLLASGDRLGALAPLLEGVQTHLAAGHPTSAGVLLRLWDEAIEALALSPDDTRLGAGWLEHARHARMAKDMTTAQAYADRVETSARDHGWQRLLAEALREQARLSRLRGDADQAWTLAVQASEQASRTADRRLQADCHWELGHVLVDRGSLDEAAAAFHQALVAYQSMKDGAGRGHCETGLAVIARQQRRIDDSRRLLERAGRHFEWSGARWGVAENFIHRGDVDRLAGDLDLARAHYQEARERYVALGLEDNALVDQREGMLWLERGQPELARPLLTRSLATFEQHQRPVLMATGHVLLLSCAAHLRDWAAWARHLDRARVLLTGADFVDVDLARFARHAGHAARHLGQTEAAKAAYTLSLGQWRGLGHQGEVAELEASLRALT